MNIDPRLYKEPDPMLGAEARATVICPTCARPCDDDNCCAHCANPVSRVAPLRTDGNVTVGSQCGPALGTVAMQGCVGDVKLRMEFVDDPQDFGALIRFVEKSDLTGADYIGGHWKPDTQGLIDFAKDILRAYDPWALDGTCMPIGSLVPGRIEPMTDRPVTKSDIDCLAAEGRVQRSMIQALINQVTNYNPSSVMRHEPATDSYRFGKLDVPAIVLIAFMNELALDIEKRFEGQHHHYELNNLRLLAGDKLHWNVSTVQERR